MLTYQEAINILYSQRPLFSPHSSTHSKWRRVRSLKTMRALCSAYDNPQNSFSTIHVAGTNGKGSVCHMLTSVFMEAGYKTGLHTSPHLIDFTERTQINGVYISQEFIVKMTTVLMQDGILDTVCPSFFEISVWMAWMYFREHMVDYAIIEAGIGGKNDATNILKPIVSVITQADYDHHHILGSTLEEIASEKAGVIKAQTPIIVGEKNPVYSHILESRASEKHAPLLWASHEMPVIMPTQQKPLSIQQVIQNATQGVDYTARIGVSGSEVFFSCPLSGNYQRKNIATVLCTLQALAHYKNICIDTNAVIRGLATVKNNTHIFGRWDVVRKNPLVIVDGAHNEAGISQVIAHVKNSIDIKTHPLHIIIGMMQTKDIQSLFAVLPHSATYSFCTIQNSRAVYGSVLRNYAQAHNCIGTVYNTTRDAITHALQNKTSTVLITGSLFLAGEAMQFFSETCNVSAGDMHANNRGYKN